MSGLPWQVDALDRFAARLARGQMPQALLVHGPEGVGRRHYALTVAARLLGVPWRPAPDLPADQLGAVPHPDYWAVGLEEESRQIKVDQIRDLARQLGMTSHGAGWKVGLICPAELMNHNAANTLLKTLEEPPPGTTLILVADSPAHLPPTIVSRCERGRPRPAPLPGSRRCMATRPPASAPWRSPAVRHCWRARSWRVGRGRETAPSSRSSPTSCSR